MVHCKNMSFDCKYIHVDAHQDHKKAYADLLWKSQLHCCVDWLAKKAIWLLIGEEEELPAQEALPLDPVAVFVGEEKMTAAAEDSLRYWCHRQEAKTSFAHSKVKFLQKDQFEEVH